MVVTQYGEDKISHNEKNDDTSTLEDAYQHFLTQHRYTLINYIIKGTVCESEVEHNCDDVNEERIFEDDVTSLPNENIFQDFSFVVKKIRINYLSDKSDDKFFSKR